MMLAWSDSMDTIGREYTYVKNMIAFYSIQNIVYLAYLKTLIISN